MFILMLYVLRFAFLVPPTLPLPTVTYGALVIDVGSPDWAWFSFFENLLPRHKMWSMYFFYTRGRS